MSSNNEKIVKVGIERYVDFTKTVSLSELGLETPKIKAPLFFVPEPKGDGKFQFHQYPDARSGFATHILETDVAGAQDKIVVATRFRINTTLTFEEFQEPQKGFVCKYFQEKLSS